jgi:hypothetical protein
MLIRIFFLSSRILVGAPLGQNLQPDTNGSGALFKCPLTLDEGECDQVVTDGKRGEARFFLFWNIQTPIKS